MPNTTAPPPKPEHRRDAVAAGLRYVRDDVPGIRRMPRGKSFAYRDDRGKRITDASTLARIASLAIPPAWTDVWICPREDGHLQATGRDERGRKQYRYHADFRARRDENKYERTLAFAAALPKIRRVAQADLRRGRLERRKVLAAVVLVLDKTLIRVGNDEYARTNRSYGLTTLRDHHATVRGHTVRFSFTGKSGVDHDIDLQDPTLAKVIRKCQDLPGQELFQYVDDDGAVCDVTSSDVNEYLREISGSDFTAKDFRTWAGTVLAAWALQELHRQHPDQATKKSVVRAIEQVAQKLGNTTAVCRKCYIHPAVIDAYLDGSLAGQLAGEARARLASAAVGKLPEQEQAVLRLLTGRLKQAARRSRRAA